MTEYMRDPKQPWEYLPITMDFAENMGDGESIILGSSSVTAINTETEEDETSNLIVDDLSIIDSTTMKVTIFGGISGKNYKASFKAFISTSKKLEEDLIFDVKD